MRRCLRARRRTPPLDATPLREKLRVERARFERALGFELGANGINFPRVGSAKKNFACRITSDAGDLRGTGLGEMREDTVSIDGEERAAIAGAGQEPAVGSNSQRMERKVVAAGLAHH